LKTVAKKTYMVGSGNVFADLGHPRPAEALAKAELARKIGALIEKRGLTQAAAAEVLQVDQPKVSALTRGRLAGFSLDRLVRFLVLLGSDVEIVVRPRTRDVGRARVMVA
jgi:predicted XRE-type DNA-binding protein